MFSFTCETIRDFSELSLRWIPNFSISAEFSVREQCWSELVFFVFSESELNSIEKRQVCDFIWICTLKYVYVFAYVLSNMHYVIYLCFCFVATLFIFVCFQEIDTQSGPKVIGVTDTNGSFQFPAMQRKTIHQSNVILLVFSITNKQSFEFLARVHDDICRCGKPKPIILVGNKCDEQSSRQVTQAQALAHAKSWGCPYVETSAKDNINIQDVFLGAARLSFEDGAATQHKNNNIGNQNSNSRRRERLKQQSGDAQTGDTPSGCCHVCCCISWQHPGSAQFWGRGFLATIPLP